MIRKVETILHHKMSLCSQCVLSMFSLCSQRVVSITNSALDIEPKGEANILCVYSERLMFTVFMPKMSRTIDVYCFYA